MPGPARHFPGRKLQRDIGFHLQQAHLGAAQSLAGHGLERGLQRLGIHEPLAGGGSGFALTGSKVSLEHPCHSGQRKGHRDHRNCDDDENLLVGLVRRQRIGR